MGDLCLHKKKGKNTRRFYSQLNDVASSYCHLTTVLD
jgi:hypothetical protein